MNSIKVESFLNHTPGTEDVKRMQAMRAEVISVFNLSESIVPNCPEKTLGQRKLEEALMWLNKAIILNPFDGEAKVDYTPIQSQMDALAELKASLG